MIHNRNSEIEFSSVSKDFLLGNFMDVIKSIFGRNCNCPRFRALHEITFNISRGEFLGVLGKNGAGKTTLLRVAAGIYNPDEGKVYTRKSPTAIFEMGILGNLELTGRKFCEIYFSFRNIPRSKQKNLIEDVKEFSELDEYFDEPMHTYSSGMLARLFFSVITAVPSEIVLIDEILSVGDEYFKGKSFKRLVKMISKGACGIIATHDWFSAVRLCDKLTILDKGKITYKGPSQEVIKKYLNISSILTKKAFFRNKKQLENKILLFKPGKPFSMTFEVKTIIEEPVSIGLTIEIPKLGIIVIIDNDYIMGKKKGIYCISFKFPSFPIAYRECYLSLFLYKPRVSGQLSSSELYDQIAWTVGNSIRLINKNPNHKSEAVISRKLRWKRIK